VEPAGQADEAEAPTDEGRRRQASFKATIQSPLEMRQARKLRHSDRDKDERTPSPTSPRSPVPDGDRRSPTLGGAHGPSQPANAGCLPGTDTGMGEGLSALFVHPDEDVYDLTEGGGILAEPPRTFEALAFAPRVDGDAPPRRQRLTGAEERAESDELLATFASAAALGAHRVPPRVISRSDVLGGAGNSGSLAGAWQMWASDNLTEAIGVPTYAALTEEEQAAAEQRMAERREPGGGERKGKKGNKEKEALENPVLALVAGIRSAAELAAEDDFRRMHIDYKGVVRKARLGRASEEELDASPGGKTTDEPDSKRRAAAAGLMKRSASPTGNRPPSKDASKGPKSNAASKPASAKAGGGKKR